MSVPNAQRFSIEKTIIAHSATMHVFHEDQNHRSQTSLECELLCEKQERKRQQTVELLRQSTMA